MLMMSTNTSKTGVKIGNQVLALKLCCFYQQLASLPGATCHPLKYQKSRQNCMVMSIDFVQLTLYDVKR